MQVGKDQAPVLGAPLRQVGQLLPAAAHVDALQLQPRQQRRRIRDIAVIVGLLGPDVVVVERQRRVHPAQVEQH